LNDISPGLTERSFPTPAKLEKAAMLKVKKYRNWLPMPELAQH
jgi:hypothetical protein